MHHLAFLDQSHFHFSFPNFPLQMNGTAWNGTTQQEASTMGHMETQSISLQGVCSILYSVYTTGW